MSERVMITGANRGIGLALASEYLSRGRIVLAGCRRADAAEALRALEPMGEAALHVISLDIDSDASCAAAAEAAGEIVDGLDVLINNAAVGGADGGMSIATVDLPAAESIFRTNTLGAIRVTRAMLPLLRGGANPRVVNISSGAGQITGRDKPGMLDYGASKAALNFVTVSLAAELRDDGITVVPMCPGWVKTDMGGPEAKIEPAESAGGIAAVVEALTIDDTGAWCSFNGTRYEAW